MVDLALIPVVRQLVDLALIPIVRQLVDLALIPVVRKNDQADATQSTHRL